MKLDTLDIRSPPSILRHGRPAGVDEESDAAPVPAGQGYARLQFQLRENTIPAHAFSTSTSTTKPFSGSTASSPLSPTAPNGALYWKAYALNRIGKRDEAIAALAVLRRDYPNSHWLNDAQALEAEVKQNAGQPVSPADESNEDIKLMAINSLMNADPERAIPLLEGLLKSNATPRVKDRAMFVLTQNRSPRAQQILADYAKGAGNPDLQVRAIRYVGMSGTPEAQQQLASVYAASNDVAVKREIISPHGFKGP